MENRSLLETLLSEQFEISKTEFLPWLAPEIKDFSVLTKTNKNLNAFFKEPLLEAAVKQLCQLIVGGKREEIIIAEKMIKANPELLRHATTVIDCAGREIAGRPLEMALGTLDAGMVGMILPHFSPLTDGEALKEEQLARFRAPIEAVLKQLESNQPAYDLKPVIDIIKNSTAEEVQAALDKNMTVKSALRDGLIAFRDAVRPTRKTDGLHYKHYTTLIQAFTLLYEEWNNLKNGDNNDKCDLVWLQIIGYLQRGLPRISRFGFARAFNDKGRTLNYKYADGAFPDTPLDDSNLSDLGFDVAIYGGASPPHLTFPGLGRSESWRRHFEQLLQTCRTYAAATSASDRSHNLLT